jgi:hypothetical protein
MNPVESNDPRSEREWNTFTVSRTNFRPKWSGDLVNLFSLIRPKRTAAETGEFAKDCAQQMASWILAHKDQFGAEDRFQIILGWPVSVRQTGRQIIKTGGTYQELEDIASRRRPVELRLFWDKGVFAS